MKKYLVDDTAYYVNAKGSGPIMLFAHGFPFDNSLFAPVVDKLASKFYCVVPDLRGFGRTALGANGHDPKGQPRVKMGRFADDLAILGSEIACELGRKGSKVFFCGLSMGGYVMLEFLRRRPQMLAGCVFCNSNASADGPEKTSNRLYLADTIDSFGVHTLADNMIPNLVASSTPKERPHVITTLHSMICSQSPQGIAAGARGMAVRRDLVDLLPTVEVPMLILGGEEDKLSPPKMLDELAAITPNSSRATIPNAGHVSPLENPEAFADAILDWYAKIA